MTKEKIIDYISYVVFIALAVLTFIFQSDLKKILIIYSFGAVLVGILYLLQKKKFGFVIFTIGLNILITYFLYKRNVLILPKAITFLVSISIASVLFISVIVNYFSNKALRKVYSLTIEGIVIDLIKEPNSNREYYMPLYQYKVHNEEYEVPYPKYFKRFIPKIGSTINLSVNPNNPEEVYFFPSKKDTIIGVVGSLLFMALCILVVISLFR